LTLPADESDVQSFPDEFDDFKSLIAVDRASPVARRGGHDGVRLADEADVYV
jgi:hypothetical protein